MQPLPSPLDPHRQRDRRSVWITQLHRRRPTALFRLKRGEQEAAAAYTFAVAAHFVLLLGHLKAKQQFFVYEQEVVLEDLRHIVARHFQGRDLARVKTPSKPTRLSQQQIIRSFSD
jgi:hypothetical protein